MNFFNKLSAAITGELLFRIVFVIEFFTLTPIRLYLLFRETQFYGLVRDPFIAKIILGCLVASLSLLAVAYWIFFPLSLLCTAIGVAVVSYSLLHQLKGALTGWERGFDGLFSHCADRFNHGVDLFMRLCYGDSYEFFLDQILNQTQLQWEPLIQIQPLSLDHYFPPIAEPAFFQPFHPVAPEADHFNLDTINLSPEAFARLRDNQNPPLSSEELQSLTSETNVDIKRKVMNYEDLFERLETTGQCIILSDRPQKLDAVLLVKLYQRDDQEFPVPMSSHIYDRASLSQWVNLHNNNPVMGRDPIIVGSGKYQGCATRYVVHPYYPTPESTAGISQELSDLAGLLRQHLEQYQQPQPAVSERNRMIAQRLRCFSSRSSSASAGGQPAVNTTSAQSPSR